MATMDRTNIALVFLIIAVASYGARADGDDRKGDDRKKSSGRGDPIISAFDGTLFEFQGQPGRFYNLVSDYGVYQLSTLLKAAYLPHHNGTYMDSLAFKARNAEVVVKAATSDSMTVTVNGFPLEVEGTEDYTRQVDVEGGESLTVRWRKFWPGFGEATHIATGGVEVLISLTPANAESKDAYLNFNFTLLQAPIGELQGVVGDTYGYVAEAKKNHAISKDGTVDATTLVPSNHYPLYPDSAYELDSFFAAPRLSIVKAGHVSKAERSHISRSLISSGGRKAVPGGHADAGSAIAFPLSASGF